MDIALIGDRHTVYGFRLAGVKNTFVVEEVRRDEIRETLRKAFAGSTCILLVTEKIAQEIRGMIEEEKRFKKGIMPIILEIPDSAGPLIAKTDPMRELIKRTVGFEIA